MTLQDEIGARARAAIAQNLPDMTQSEVAARLEMPADALSRALNGKRSFASIELAKLADLTATDVHELITGVPDPNRMTFVARHDYDPETGDRSVPSKEQDARALKNLELAYQQAGQLPPSDPVPVDPDHLRQVLGDDFVRYFADRIQELLDVDVIRIPDLAASYSMTWAGRSVIALPANGGWFWQNYCLAHELGHLAHGHHDVEQVPELHEQQANAFAAQLLMPAGEVTSIDWSCISHPDLAQFIWRNGVSTKALATRLKALKVERGPAARELESVSTQALLRRHLHTSYREDDAITRRMSEAAVRSFPLALTEAHVRKIGTGEIGKGTLSWMWKVPVDALGVDEPRPTGPPKIDALAMSLGLSTDS